MHPAPLSDDAAAELAVSALPLAGYAPTPPTSLARGTTNVVVAFAQHNVALRVSPSGLSRTVRRGYSLSQLVPTALTPSFVTAKDSHVVAFFDLASPASSSRSSSWQDAQRLSSFLHEMPLPSLHLPVFDPIGDLPARITHLAHSPLDAWVKPLRLLLARSEASLSRHYFTPRVIHGDLHAAQVVYLVDKPHLTDFDHAALGPIEADWGRIYAWFNADQLPGAALATAWDEKRTDPHIGFVSLYARFYAMRYVTFLASLYLDSPDTPPSSRLAPFANTLGLDTTMLPPPLAPTDL